MKDYRLRNHIPISGPATREPFVGDEPELRVSLGFTPRWYHTRLGIDFSEAWHLDPAYRYETLVAMKEHLHQCFPRIDYFTPTYVNGLEPTCATISGVHGGLLMALIYGLEVIYTPDGWPSAHPDKLLTREKIEKLEPFDLEANPVVQQLLGQMELIERKWGRIHGYLNYQGILNNAVRIRGNELYMDMYDDPEFVQHLFQHIAQTTLAVARLVQARQRKSGFAINLLSMSNCTVNMISPQQYATFVRPHDLMLSREFDRFGIHTCNWDVTPYIDVLRPLEKLGYLDMGLMSDLARVRAAFPHTRRAVLYSPVELENKPIEDIRQDIEKIRAELAPCDIVLADVENTTPDSRVIQFLDLVQAARNQTALAGV